MIRIRLVVKVMVSLIEREISLKIFESEVFKSNDKFNLIMFICKLSHRKIFSFLLK